MLSVVKTKMPVKHKLNAKTLKEKCDSLSHIDKGMTNKEAANKSDVPKNTISIWIKNKGTLVKEALACHLHFCD